MFCFSLGLEKLGLKLAFRVFSGFFLTSSFLIPSLGAQDSPPNRYVKGMYSLPVTFDPALMEDTASLTVSNFIYEGLLRFNSNLDIQGAIAKTWLTQEAGKKILFTLNGAARFHNGKPITPRDVIVSFERLLGPESLVYSHFDCIEGAEAFHQRKAKNISGIQAIGEDQILIRLNYPFPAFLSILAGSTSKILPAEAKYSSKFFKHPIGSGPFQFVGIQKEKDHKDLILSRFEDYAGMKPHISEFVLRSFRESEALRQAQLGLVHDLANFPFNGNESLFKNNQPISVSSAATLILALNSRLAPFDSLKIRKSFRKSLNREEFREKFMPHDTPAFGYIPPGLPGYLSSPVSDEPDIFSDFRSSAVIKIAIAQVLPQSPEIKTYLEKSFANQGWKVQVIPLEWSAFMKTYQAKTLHAFLVLMDMEYPDPEFAVRVFESNHPNSFSGLKSPALDQIIQEARLNLNKSNRDPLYRKFAKILHDEAVTINIAHPRDQYWVHPCVIGFVPNHLADVYLDYRKVFIQPNCQHTARSLSSEER